MKIAFAAAMLMAVASPAMAATELVRNGSFEADSVTGRVSFINHVTGWTGGRKLTFLVAPGQADTPGTNLRVYGPFPTTSPVGGNFIMADGDPNYADAFSQVISGLTIGHTYELGFYQAAGQQYGFKGPTTERFKVSFGSQSQLSTKYTLPQAGVGAWEKQTMRFVAGATSQTLSFLAVGTPGGAPPISFLDGVSMTAVPEPASWAMMLIGFGMAGGAMRRRRTVLATA